MKARSATEKSEEEIRLFLERHFGAKDIERNPKVGDKKADFKVKSLDTYVEVRALKDIASDQIEIMSQEENVTKLKFKVIAQRLKDNGRKKILDRIANKLLGECTQLPDGKRNLIVTKTEGFFLYPDDVIEAIIGEPRLLINKENMQPSVERGRTAFRTEEELQQVLRKISAVLAYKAICEHGKLFGIIGNNKNYCEVPFDDKAFAIFHSFLCDKC